MVFEDYGWIVRVNGVATSWHENRGREGWSEVQSQFVRQWMKSVLYICKFFHNKQKNLNTFQSLISLLCRGEVRNNTIIQFRHWNPVYFCERPSISLSIDTLWSQIETFWHELHLMHCLGESNPRILFQPPTALRCTGKLGKDNKSKTA